MYEQLSEEDFALINALQVRPRATWSQLARVLGVAPSTLSRRWARLEADGSAWVTAYPRPGGHGAPIVALVDVDCESGMTAAVCHTLAQDSRIFTIEQTASGRDLLLTVSTQSFPDFSTLLIDELAAVPGVASVRGHVVSQMHIDGSAWRLDALSRDQLRRLASFEEPTEAGVEPRVVWQPPPEYGPLVAALTRNARATAVDLAEQLDRPVSTVRRQVAWLIRSRTLTFRCEVAQLRTRWPVMATWWCRVPEKRRLELVDAVRTRPTVRLCVTLTGPTNFLLTMWSASPDEVLQTQGWLEQQVPEIDIQDVALTLRNHKRLGWMLDPEGRATGEVVPIWPWTHRIGAQT